jgi:hypothetical protein
MTPRNRFTPLQASRDDAGAALGVLSLGLEGRAKPLVVVFAQRLTRPFSTVAACPEAGDTGGY